MHSIGNVLRVLIVVIVCITFFGGRPPAKAQNNGIQDAIQNEQIAQLQKHTDVNEQSHTQMMNSISAIKDDVSQLKGEERGLFLCLGVLQICAMIWDRKKSKP